MNTFYAFAVAAALTAFAGPQEWYIWLALAFLAPITDWLGHKLAVWIKADQLGEALRDRLFRRR